MYTFKTVAAAGAAWLGILGSAHAYEVDWNAIYEKPVLDFPQQIEGTSQVLLLKNYLGWSRMVSAWQSFVMRGDLSVRAIALQVAAVAPGSMDLNVYEGEGIDGRLLGTTQLIWNSTCPNKWYSFKFSKGLFLRHNKVYTFALENLLKNDTLYVTVNPNNTGPFKGRYMHQGFYGGTADYRGYTVGIYEPAINFKLLE